MPNVVNNMIIRELEGELEGIEGMLMVSFGGLTVAETEGIRGALDAKGVKFRMLRNKLARRVMTDKGWEVDPAVWTGNNALAYGGAEAAIEAAKVLTDKELKKDGKVQVKLGMLQGRMLDAGEAASLADIPDKDTLRAKIVGCIAGPARSLVGVLNANPSGMARLLQARADQLTE